MPTEVNDMPHNKQSRKEWPLAIIGLPDSGKSTFLARLYGAGLEGVQGSSSNCFSLSFPPAIIPEECQSLEQVKKLWDWICSNFDKKKKTVNEANFTFNISGPGLMSGLKVLCQDLPGETFQTPKETDSDLIDPHKLQELKKEMHRKYRYLHGAIILIESSKADDPASTALVRGMLDFLPRYTNLHVPVMKLVIFTKAASPTPDEQLQNKISRLQTQWKKQGYSWVNVIACESISDLQKTTDDGGQIRWSLPVTNGEMVSSAQPAWIYNPTAAILELPRMLIAYRARRRLLLILISVAIIFVLSALWCLQGYQSDRKDFDGIINEPDAQIGKSFERYLTVTSYNFRNLYYPFKHYTGSAKSKWNDWFFDKHIRGTINLEAITNDLNAVQQRQVWKYVERERYTRTYSNSLEQCRVMLGKFNTDMSKLRFDACEADNPGKVINEAGNDYPEMPSLKHGEKEVRDKLKLDFEDEETKVKRFAANVNQWSAVIKPLIDELQLMSNEPRLKFGSLQTIRERDLTALGKNVESTGLESVPYQSNRLLLALKTAIKKQISQEGEELQHVQKVLDKVGCQIRETQKRASDLREKFSLASTWLEKCDLCASAIGILKDLPEGKEWEVLKTEWNDKITSSQRVLTDTLKKVKDKNEDPQEQLTILTGLIDDLAPEHKTILVAEETKIKEELKDLRQKWDNVEKAFLRYIKDCKELIPVEVTISDYRSCLQGQGRPCVKDHMNDFAQICKAISDERGRVDKLFADRAALWVDAGHKDVEKRKVVRRRVGIILQQLQLTFEHQRSQPFVNEWFANIKGRVNSIRESAVSTDEEYDEVLDCIGLVSELYIGLHISKDEQMDMEESKQSIQLKWADQHWKKVEVAANDFLTRNRFSDAIQVLREYQNQPNTRYQMFTVESDSKIKLIASRWSVELCENFGKLGKESIKEKKDYTERRDKITAWINAFVKESSITADLKEARRNAENELNSGLQNWYIGRVDGILGSLPQEKEKAILASWDKVDALMKLFEDIRNDNDINSFNRRLSDKAYSACEKLKQLKKELPFELAFSSIQITMENADYWGTNNYPEPVLRFINDGKELWRISLKAKAHYNEVQDSVKNTRSYQVTQNKEASRFVVLASDWKGDNIDYIPNGTLILKMEVARQVTEVLELVLITKENTPGCLLRKSQPLAVKGDVKYKPYGANENTMPVYFKIDVNAPKLEPFYSVPFTFADWPNP